MTEKQKQLDIRYMKMAEIWAENSYCKRRQVGALLVKDKMIILMDIMEPHQDLKMIVRMKMV